MANVEIKPQKHIAKPSAQSLMIEMLFNETVLATGTAFLVQENDSLFLVTNRHNFTGRDQNTGKPLSPSLGVANRIRIWHNFRQKMGVWIPIVQELYKDQIPIWTEHPKLGGRADIAAIFVENLSQIAPFTYRLHQRTPTIKVDPADPVSVVGFPFGLSQSGRLAIWATGFVASDLDIDFNELPAFLIDCRTRPGQSGSPVIAYRGSGVFSSTTGGQTFTDQAVTRLLGIYSGRINKDSDIGLVWKLSAIKELVGAAQSTV